jgi:hypothetical protein
MISRLSTSRLRFGVIPFSVCILGVRRPLRWPAGYGSMSCSCLSAWACSPSPIAPMHRLARGARRPTCWRGRSLSERVGSLSLHCATWRVVSYLRRGRRADGARALANLLLDHAAAIRNPQIMTQAETRRVPARRRSAKRHCHECHAGPHLRPGRPQAKIVLAPTMPATLQTLEFTE